MLSRLCPASRWRALSAALFTELVAGSSYAFAVYSPALRTLLGLTQQEVATIAAFMNLGGYTAFAAGLLFDAYGAGPTLLAAALLLAVGYGGVTGIVRAAAASAPGAVTASTAVLCLLFFVWGHGAAFADTVAVATSIRNFPQDRGLVLGLIKSGFGLSAGFYTITYNSFLANDVPGLLLFLALFSPLAVLAVAPFFAVLPPAGTTPLVAPERCKVFAGYGVNIAVAGFIAAVSSLNASKQLPSVTPYGAALLPLIALFALQALPAALFACRCMADGSSSGSTRKAAAAAGDGDGGLEGEGEAAASAPLLLLRGGSMSGASVGGASLDAEYAAALLQLTAGGGGGGGGGGAGAGAGAAAEEEATLDFYGAGRAGAGGGRPPRVPRAGAGAGKGAGSLSFAEDAGGDGADSVRSGAGAAARHARAAAAVAAANSSARGVSGASLVEAVLAADFWLLLFVLYCGTGSGIVFINQLGNLAQSLGAAPDGQDIDVTLLAVANCLGRMFFGAASEASARILSRAGWLTLATASMAGAMVFSAFSPLASLPLATVWVGFSFGAFWALGPSLLADRFGGRSFASIYALSTLSTAAASFSLNAGLATAIYRAHLPAGAAANATCLGAECFRATFLILAALAAAATLVAAALTLRTRALYVGAGGAAIDYAAWRAARGGTDACTRATQRVLLRSCRCPRAVVVSDDESGGAGGAAGARQGEEEEEDDGFATTWPMGGGGGGYGPAAGTRGAGGGALAAAARGGT